MATTIRDVAEVAQVSAATVSRVLRGDTRNGFGVSEATRDRIMAIAQSMNYQANAAASAMASGRTGLIGIVINEVTNSFLNGILAGIQSYVKHNDLAIVLYTEVDQDARRSEKKLLRAIRSRQVDGVLLAHYQPSEELIATLTDQKMPYVMLSPEAMPGKAVVHVDDEEGGRLAGEHLLSLGHRDIAVLGISRSYSEARWRGVEKATSTAAVSLHHAMWSETDLPTGIEYLEYSQVVCEKLLRQHSEITGIICTEDTYAVGANKAARKIGRQVPRDLSIIGYDNMDWTAYMDPPLSTIQQPKELQGRRSMKLLQELIEGGDPHEIWMKPELVVRESTAPPPTAIPV